MRNLLVLCLVCLPLLLAGCVQFDSRRGVEVAWQDKVVAGLEKGKSTRKDVLDLLGPPSQVIALQDETVLYYLFEKSEGDGLILIVYNRIDIEAHYDRAIFFFDDNGILTDFATKVRARDDQ